MRMSFIIDALDFECILRLNNRQAVRCDQYDLMKNITGNKKLDIPEGCERVAILLTTPNHYCHNTTHLVGSMEISFRHLKKLGYRLVIVRFNFNHYLNQIFSFSFLIMNYQQSIHLQLDIVI
jgi:hypothetical protein